MMDVATVDQLRHRGIDAVSVRDIKRRGTGDLVLLQLAREEGRAIVTADRDYKDLAQTGMYHCGIFFVVPTRNRVGYLVNRLETIVAYYTLEMMEYRFEYL